MARHDPQPRRLEHLIFLPVLGALLGIWAITVILTLAERRATLERAQSQLGITIATLADFNELAEKSTANSPDESSASRTAAIWRALVQYPAANIWFESGGILLAGDPPRGEQGAFILVTDTRAKFTVHASLPRAEALSEWRRAAWLRGSIVAVASFAFLFLTRVLASALRQRSDAERERAATQERVTQLALYRSQLEETVAQRTQELKSANEQLGKELIDRKAAQDELRQHDALLNVVTRSAAELLGPQHDDAISVVLELIGRTMGVSRVQLGTLDADGEGRMRASIRHEWRALEASSAADDPHLRELEVSACFGNRLAPIFAGQIATFFVDDIREPYRALFEAANLRSFLHIPLPVEDKLWGTISFIDSEHRKRQWTWAETDTLKTLAGLIGVSITRARYVKELADANMIVQNSPTILYRLRGEPAFPLIYISHNITKFGHDPHKLLAMPSWARELVDSEDLDEIRDAMASMLEDGTQGAAIEFRLKTGDGSRRWVENRYTPVRDADGRLVEVEGIVVDITERKAAEERIAQLARTDALTGLANRATFMERLHQAFAAAQRGAGAFAVLYIDLDHFKPVNDVLGHASGDLLLREAANRLKGQVRSSDVVARLGGDEFAVLQMEMGEPANAGVLAGKIQKCMALPFELRDNTVQISSSIGVCPYLPGTPGPDALLAQADLALYRAKEEGRNGYRFHTDDLDHEVLERVALAEELRSAIEHDQLEVHYQPQLEISSGHVVAMEAHVHWKHPTRGVLGPDTFLPVAEKTGLMVTLGHWILDRACRQMRQWRDMGIAPELLTLNLSFIQVKSNRELIRDVMETTAKWGLAPSDIEFDVTEEILAKATLAQNDALARLRELGSRVAIDNFGTKYSSFDYFKSYGVSELKLAPAYLSESDHDPGRAATLRAVMTMARELNLRVVAEGVETRQQCKSLLASCSTTQTKGYYLGPPIDAGRAEAMLRTGRGMPLPEDTGTWETNRPRDETA
jgi:diguanylate cyclase (GGDEF)-like protein/PAS domain S-box-containing protein